MSFKEIQELRKTGKLDEALTMANQALEADPENIWNKRAAAWVYYDYLKKYEKVETYELFKEYLIKIKDLQLPENEKLLFDNCAWKIGKLVSSLEKLDPIDYAKIDELFDIIKYFHFTKPSEAYTFIYKTFHKHSINWSNYLSFAEWWDFDNFRSEDYLKDEFNGKKKMAIVEQAYIAYSKKLLKGETLDSFGELRLVDKDKIRFFLPKLDSLINKHPEYEYPPYFKAKLLLALGNEENALSAFLPFAKQKRNDFWVWVLMAEIFSYDKDIQFACYCKALSLKTPEEYLVKLRQSFAEMLIEKRMYDEAKTEILKIITTRERKDWKVPNQILKWTEQEWYKSATSKNDNSDLYLKHSKIAEEILIKDLPEELIVVEFVNEVKGILNFVKNKNKFGFFKYFDYISNPKIGDLIMVRFDGNGRDGFYRILSARKVDDDLPCDAIKSFNGKLTKKPSQNFGFVNDIFVEPKIIERYNLRDGQFLSGMAILSYHNKKKTLGWKVIKITY
ncbi:MAG: hypothetical protein PWR03_1979 [Tenuifilum sp.]|jgi:hypothetical protein|uniref:DUF7017 domain-containing protein n=1 Tax=Tenuifilum sp. TaxID=2760880 RepID=UPI0024AB830A|nr:hypothetical protein [Tenuifilum sp.]MDI3527796.1 hypothetical protein [Tenuifilum sp.]